MAGIIIDEQQKHVLMDHFFLDFLFETVPPTPLKMSALFCSPPKNNISEDEIIRKRKSPVCLATTVDVKEPYLGSSK